MRFCQTGGSEQRGSVEWPLSSPDLTPVDFLWGYLKDKVYSTKPAKVDERRHWMWMHSNSERNIS